MSPTRASVLALFWQARAEKAGDYGTKLPHVETAWIYGNVNKYAYYYIDLLIGSPEPQRTSVIIDTGSRVVSFPCEGCIRCGKHMDTTFDLSHSATAKWLPCGGACPSKCSDGYCEYKVRYGEGSSLSGRWFTDLVQLDGPTGHGAAVRANLGCHLEESSLFFTQRANGIMGLAPSSPDSSHTILHDLFEDKKHVNTSVFSICLNTWGGRLMVGGHDPSYREGGSGVGKIQYLDMVADTFYRVFPSSLLLEGITIAAGSGAFGLTIVDSGTTFTEFPRPVHQNLLLQLGVYCSLHEDCNAAKEVGASGEQCWRLRDMMRGPRDFPLLEMTFDRNIRINWPPHAYLRQAADPHLWCNSFREGRDTVSVLGVSWMLHKDVIFDLGRRRVGVVQTTCPERGRPSELLSEASLADTSKSLDNRGAWGPVAAALLPLFLLTAAAVTGHRMMRRQRPYSLLVERGLEPSRGSRQMCRGP